MKHFLILWFLVTDVLVVPFYANASSISDWIYSIEGIGMKFSYEEDTNSCKLFNVEEGASGKLTIPSNVMIYGSRRTVNGIDHKALYHIDGITEIIVPSSVTSVDNGAFQCASGLTKVELPNVTSVGENVFGGCTNLKTVSLPKVTKILGRGTFSGCKSLTNISIPNVTEIQGERNFANCEKLTNIDFLPNNINTDLCASFEHCSGLVNITIPKWIKKLYATFEYCSNLENVTLQEGITIIGLRTFSGCKLKGIIFPNSLDSIGSGAFDGCPLQNINIPQKLTKFSPALAFSGCKDLQTISVASGNQRYDSRNDCNAIIEKSTSKLVLGCYSTTIPNSVRIIGRGAFNNCPLLTNMNLPERLSVIEENAFSGTSLASVSIPSQVSEIGSHAFPKTLETIIVDEENEVYDSRNDCNALIESATNTLLIGNKNTFIPEGIVAIADEALSEQKEIKEMYLPQSLTSIGKAAFSGCSGLTELIIPAKVSSIDGNAFYNCSGLTTITCHLKEPMAINENVFLLSDKDKKYDIYDKATLRVPKGTKKKYWNVAGWSRFENIVEMGDANVDSSIDVADIATIISVMAGGGDEATRKLSDVNCDGVVDVADIASVISIMASR